ncbi:serine/threonine-protein kinase [Plesiomonas shigelloides]|uniref:Serine/threonine protein kinase n=1 Tax=Plesiomonas shigelloides 302-73 TaxID=1315976 RepID=R8AW24_PLESH|nr:serine/threonine-protein kinase [Plesiomonas shigelloides]EON90506.1 Serine/threonine protein kinase [Plesiomonas shigelloides 302-73]
MFAYQKAQVSFKKLEEIGHEGLNSRVYRAHDQNLDAEIVIKEIEIKDGFSAKDYFEEAQALYKSTHPNIVQICYACEDDKMVYVASPFYRNGSLKKKMAQKNLTVREIIRYSTHFLNGLHNVHSKGLIHFDIKPDNVLISDRNEALLADFGQSKPMDRNGLAKQPILYGKQLPPEYFGNTQFVFDNRFDIYQAGLTMYRMCVGDNEFERQFSKYNSWPELGRDIRAGIFPDRKAYPLHIPNKLQRVINKCLKPNPGDRYGSPVEIVNGLADIDGTILDWEYAVDEKSRTWRQQVDGTVKILEVCEKGTSKAYKHGVNSPARRVKEFCLSEIEDKKIVEFLET